MTPVPSAVRATEVTSPVGPANGFRSFVSDRPESNGPCQRHRRESACRLRSRPGLLPRLCGRSAVLPGQLERPDQRCSRHQLRSFLRWPQNAAPRSTTAPVGKCWSSGPFASQTRSPSAPVAATREPLGENATPVSAAGAPSSVATADPFATVYIFTAGSAPVTTICVPFGENAMLDTATG